MKSPFVFASACPDCRQQRCQHGHTRRTLIRLIQSGQIIDAYCLSCDLVWPVSAEERVLIAQAIAVWRRNAPPQAGGKDLSATRAA